MPPTIERGLGLKRFKHDEFYIANRYAEKLTRNYGLSEIAEINIDRSAISTTRPKTNWTKYVRKLKRMYYRFIGKPYHCSDCGKNYKLLEITYVSDFEKLVCHTCLESDPIY